MNSLSSVVFGLFIWSKFKILLCNNILNLDQMNNPKTTDDKEFNTKNTEQYDLKYTT